MALGEFELIARYFARRTPRADVRLGIGDDAAVLDVRADRKLVVAMDTVVEGVHFPPQFDASDVGYRALAVNLSDLAAMGAEPAWFTLSLSMPDSDEHWIERFAAGLFELADLHDLALIGGDTVRGPRVVTVQVLGFVPAGLALRRDGARPGDVLYASGSLGDAAAGLKLLRDGRRADTDSSLVRRYRFAEPRLALGMALRGVASAAIDVSDGLLGDLGKLCDASGVGAILELEQLPLSRALLASFDATQAERFALGGGDDYELAFAVPRAAVSEMETSLATIGRITRIGEIVTGHGVRCQRAGQTVKPGIAGYDHFG
jgi:thiamine-monophosphate kinase